MARSITSLSITEAYVTTELANNLCQSDSQLGQDITAWGSGGLGIVTFS